MRYNLGLAYCHPVIGEQQCRYSSIELLQLDGGQVVAILLAVVCCLGWCGLGWRIEKCVQQKGEGLLCTDNHIIHSKKGMHKLIKSATLQ